MGKAISGKELLEAGFEQGAAMGQAIAAAARLMAKGVVREEVLARLRRTWENPAEWKADQDLGPLAKCLSEADDIAKLYGSRRDKPIAFPQWGTDIDNGAIAQMEMACRLPVTVGGALMPDAHLGYGLPVGGVLATEDAIIPYAVGVDIGCRLKFSVLDVDVEMLETRSHDFVSAIQNGTQFGLGAEWKNPKQHEVMDLDWNVTKVTKNAKDIAYKQLGSSGTGNHFVEFGAVSFAEPALGLDAGTYVGLLSHSGSRKPGALVCDFYHRLAQRKLPTAFAEFKQLAWLPMATEEGQEYFLAMNLMGAFAEANHAVIHRTVTRALNARIIAGVENHHNFAWVEDWNGRKVYVHRKGATPAQAGTLGFIPGSMADPGYVVRGKGNAESVNSSSHGAGRRMSRRAAKEQFTWAAWRAVLRERNVNLISAGLDEVPGAYKPIREVMAAQTDLVDILGEFMPRIVKMAEDGESED